MRFVSPHVPIPLPMPMLAAELQSQADFAGQEAAPPEILSVERLEAFAENLAKTQEVFPFRNAGVSLTRRLRSNAEALNASYQALVGGLRHGDSITPAAAWLIDNFYIIDEHIKAIKRDLPSGFYAQLPKLSNAVLLGYPRVYGIVVGLIDHTDNLFESETLYRYCQAYQRIRPLTIGELWAIAITLRVVLIDNLSQLALGIVARLSQRAQADALADQWVTQGFPTEGQGGNVTPTPMPRAFAAQLLRRLRDHDRAVTPALAWLHQTLAAQGLNADELVHGEHQRQGAVNVSVRNIITSLRLISSVDWAQFFESVSTVDALLRSQSQYGTFDFATRDLYRHAVEELARRSSHTELEVTHRALDTARRVSAGPTTGGATSSPPPREPGCYLIGDGRRELERQLGYRASWRERAVRAISQLGVAGYATLVFALAAAFTALCLMEAPLTAGAGWMALLIGAALLAATDVGIAIVNLSVTHLCRPAALPALDLKAGVPAELRTLMVVPILLTTAAEIEENLRNLEVHYLATSDGYIQFALLSDWSDSNTEHAAEDTALLAVAEAGIARLNQVQAQLNESRFLLLHRRRRWNESEGCWMGWERKRGKLHELNRLLRGATDTSFMELGGRCGALSMDVRYVITLDADTRLPRGAAYTLIGKMAHPLNHPVFDRQRGRVTSGYGILQPRVTPALPTDSEGTFFQRVSSGPSGMDPYAFAVSDAYQDLFAEGSYSGKGIYDVDAFEASLDRRVPEGKMLSHDLFEGSFARCGLASDVEVVEEYPARYEVASARQHRWTRGDWQLLPWILSDGSLTGLARWKMIDNLRRSLIAPAIALGAALCALMGAPVAWTAFFLAAISVPVLLPWLTAWLPRAFNLRHGGARRLARNELLQAGSLVGLRLIFLADQAWMAGDAIARTLYRLAVSRRHLLEWTTSAQAKKSAVRLVGRMSGGWLLGIGATLAILAVTGEIPWDTAPWLVGWLIAPAIARRISARSAPLPKQALSIAERQTFESMARETWKYFDTYVTAEHHSLPPDNFQETPAPIVAHRTSPTNIGLYLLSVVAAHDFGWLTLEAALDRLEATFDTLDKLEKFRGHCYNWYDTHDLRPLDPKYISTVDSGNLCGHLLALGGACRHWQSPLDTHTARLEKPMLRDRLLLLERRARTMALGMEFDFLLQPDRQLLSIGFRLADRAQDPSCYDLLASEARLASFVAIAKGDLPVRHWFRLGRRLTPVDRSSALVSWSGSMFEYLMPILVMREPEGSVLGETARMIVKRQIEYGKDRRIPWGVSESAFNARDREFTYQYSSFGVPGLGLQRGLADEAVVAPYATGLAAMIDAKSALHNFRRLQALDARGHFGWYDALDFTPSRVPHGETSVAVRAYMAHHQGMMLVSIANILQDGNIRTYFHSDPLIQATELLLQEKLPRELDFSRTEVDIISAPAPREISTAAPRQYSGVNHATPRTHLLSNGTYSVMLTAAGSGYSRYKNIAVTRWHEDPTCDARGSYVFLRDVANGDVWSVGHQPSGKEADSYQVEFFEDRAEIIRRDGTLLTSMDLVVSSEDNAEVRRVTITNEGRRFRELEITTYAEVVLAPPDADAAHPAFSKLFVQTEFDESTGALLATRRRRDPADPELWVAHVSALEGEALGTLQVETDRGKFLGRGRELRNAVSIMEARPLSGSVGTVLDPILSLRRRVRIAPGDTARVAFWTIVAPSRAQACALAAKHRDKGAFERAKTLAWTQAQVQLRYLGIDFSEAQTFQRLANRVIYSDASLRAPREILENNHLGQSSVWPLGLSGDLPIVLVRIDDEHDLKIVNDLLRAHEYWRLKGLAVDLIILNDLPPSYASPLQLALDAAIRGAQSAPEVEGGARGGIFLLRADSLRPEILKLLLVAARAVFAARRGTLNDQLARVREPPLAPSPRDVPEGESRAQRSPPLPSLEFFNGQGGFCAGAQEYVIVLDENQWTPAPWSNVIANPQFGFMTSADGTGSTWSLNAQQNQLTPWSNDPVSNAPAEVVYLRDAESGALWSVSPQPIRHTSGSYVTRHGFGYSSFAHESHGIAAQLLQFVPLADSVKIGRLTLTNHSGSARKLTVTHYLEWVLGHRRSRTAPFLVTAVEPATGALLARNPWNAAEYQGQVAFLDLGGAQQSMSGDRLEFLGRHGTLAEPAALLSSDPLSGRVGGGFDPCGALQTQIELQPGEEKTLILLLGVASSTMEAAALIQRYRAADLDAILSQVTDSWQRVLGVIQVKTADRSMDVLLNGWLLYQTLACRVWARAAFYQSSGAYGFRDQLQDVMALCVAMPALAREHLLRAAGRQFPEGDVQHWWLATSGLGVKTRIADDRLWLPYVLSHYLDVTEDSAILDESVPFLVGEPLADGVDERCWTPAAGAMATLYQHCVLALDSSLGVGSHGLPLFGTGDWNDGMNRVGAQGRGESVWMAWFLHATLIRFAPLAEQRGDSDAATRWRKHAFALQRAAEREAWDGDWYRRGYFDDGTPLGSISSEECLIDSIAQSWAVISGAADPIRSTRAMAAVDRQLVNRSDGLIQLFTPPFNRAEHDPGYVMAYPKGLRENGGQYTHAALWTVLAFALLGDGDRAGELFALLNPINHGSRSGIHRYRVEPYVACADVYTAPTHRGRGGWTWYTGSAAWMYRTAVEAILGVRVRGSRLVVDPCIPKAWEEFEITYTHHSSRYRITVLNPDKVSRGVKSLSVDGTRAEAIALADDGLEHTCIVTLGLRD